ncbi:MAG TPA: sigma-70 family RNA polymerase sigma factor [Burkholderiaceae bacterium]|nr:sigma-70 family RNA polymerase sigma factor [Burkholderiaceae bacterium]
MDSSAPEPGADDDLIGRLESGRREFLALVDPLRPQLHRYCARMTGSIADGEDVVQETLAAAYYELSQMKSLPQLRPWLFRIAHNRAIDHWRREQMRQSEPLDAALEVADDATREPDQALARQQATRAAISAFLALAPAQRACVVLKDVLEQSLDEIALALDMSVPAVKAALHRGRVALGAGAAAGSAARTPTSPQLQRYASLFNARDWDGVRAQLAADVRVELVSRRKMAGSEAVTYFTNYQGVPGWRLSPAWLDGREVLAVRLGAAERPAYLIALHWRDGRVQTIRDYRYVPYIAAEARFEPAD